jgi:threonyl-tRNA synthetase
VRLLPVTDAHQEYCQQTKAKLLKAGIRCEIDRGADRLAKQIRNASKDRIPVIGVVGEREVESNTINVRTPSGVELGAFDVDVVMKTIVAANAGAIEFQEALDKSAFDV